MRLLSGIGKGPGAGDAIIGLALILFCVAFLVKTAALPEPFDEGPGPALFPTIILSGLLIAGVALVLGGLRSRPRPSGETAGKGSVVAVAGMLATIAAYVLALRWTPFLVATPVMIVVAALVGLRFRASRTQMATVLAAAVVGTLLIEIVFIGALGIRL